MERIKVKGSRDSSRAVWARSADVDLDSENSIVYPMPWLWACTFELYVSVLCVGMCNQYTEPDAEQ